MMSTPRSTISGGGASTVGILVLVSGFVADALRYIDHVLAGIAVGGDLDVGAEELQVAGDERAAEDVGLRAGIVHEVLALDVEARGFEHGCEHAADRGAAAVAGGERAGGVGADELDLDALAAADVEVTERCAGSGDRVHLLRQPRLRQAEVDEAGGRGLCGREHPLGLDALSDLACEVERVRLRGAAEAQRQVRRVVAVFGAAGALDDDLGQGHLRDLAGGHGSFGGGPGEVRQIVADGHGRSNGNARCRISPSTSSTAARA